MDDTSADLQSLLDHLKGAQHALIGIAELENTIAAVLALTEERQDS